MDPLRNSDLAAVSTGEAIVLFYQSASKIIEVSSKDGKAWTATSTLADGELHDYGSPLTAFYVKHDGSNEEKPSIHVVYLDKNDKLSEQVRAVQEKTWKKLDFPQDIAKKPINTTKLASGVCHDDADSKSHHWLYFSDEDGKGGQEIAELRKGSESSWDWVYRKVLPEAGSASLPGTTIASSFTDAINYLYFQDHDKNVFEYEGTYGEWSSGKTVDTGSGTIINTPLAACIDTKDKLVVFYASKSADNKIWIQVLIDGKSSQIAQWTPGSFIGAVMHDGKSYLFLNEVKAPTAISTYVYDGTTWADLGPIHVN